MDHETNRALRRNRAGRVANDGRAIPNCSVAFSGKDLCLTECVHDDDTFERVELIGTFPLIEAPGFSSLPGKRLYVLILQDRRSASVNIAYLDTASLSGEYCVHLCQLPALTNGGPPPQFVEPDSSACSSTSLDPDGFATIF